MFSLVEKLSVSGKRHTLKKEKKIFLKKYKEILKRSVAKSYMTNGYMTMVKYLRISPYKVILIGSPSSVPHI
jgi:hypothetical protein